MTQQRLQYDDSIRLLRERGYFGPNEHPPMPDHVPQPEDEAPLGLSFYKTCVGDDDLSNLSVPRTFFGRSEIRNAVFRNTDLTESNLRWNDFIDVDFTDAILARADLRASIFSRVQFSRTDLRGADMRRSVFEECVFDHALMDGAVLARNQGSRLTLSDVQKAAIDWRESEGPQPSGG